MRHRGSMRDAVDDGCLWVQFYRCLVCVDQSGGSVARWAWAPDVLDRSSALWISVLMTHGVRVRHGSFFALGRE